MNLKLCCTAIIILLAFASQALRAEREPIKDYCSYVNPLMGTMSDIEFSAGNTYPAIARPWGMNFWTPQTGSMGDGWIYKYTDRKICGFKQTHQPSPWINDYGMFSIMPVIGDKITETERASWFSHKAETALPYYYSAYLAEHDILTELTPTERAVAFRFTFPESGESAIVIDAYNHGSYVKVLPEENRVIGYSTRNSGGVPANFRNYFVIEYDKADTEPQVWYDGQLCDCDERTGDHVGAVLKFRTAKGEKIELRAASSFISLEQAVRNLDEANYRSFDEIEQEGHNAWNEVLGVFDIEAEPDQMKTFYSCLYRSLLFPRMLYEYGADGSPIHYSPYDGGIHEGYMFTDTGFWDTFRSLFPLLNLAYPSMNARMQEGLLNTFRQSGFLPEWASPGHRWCMVGNNSASVVADAIVKGVTPERLREGLYEAMITSANTVHSEVPSTGRWGYEHYNTLGYVPYDIGINESAARTLEYAYDDWCIAQAGLVLGKPAWEVDLYLKRSQNYRNLFDQETRLMRERNEDGTFQSPFNPLKWRDAFTEGNSWHYTWSVFHDPEGLIELMGGPDGFNGMMDSVFTVPPVFDESYYGSVIHEIREMQVMNMGNYAHGNQPVQHMIYMYNYSGQPWKAQYRVREVMDKFYSATPDGYCGDEDNGQTSAWYVFSALGFYPVCPASDQYILGSPLVKKAVINLENGNKIIIDTKNNSSSNRYLSNLKINKKPYGTNFLRHEDLMRGANLVFDMAPKPNLDRGIDQDAHPYSYSQTRNPYPVIRDLKP